MENRSMFVGLDVHNVSNAIAGEVPHSRGSRRDLDRKAPNYPTLAMTLCLDMMAVSRFCAASILSRRPPAQAPQLRGACFGGS